MTALKGLRRLADHARRLLDLAVERVDDDPVTSWGQADRVAMWHAALLAEQVLQLVADCIEDDEPAQQVPDGAVHMDLVPRELLQQLRFFVADFVQPEAGIHDDRAARLLASIDELPR